MKIHRFIIGIEIVLIVMLSYAVYGQEKVGNSGPGMKTVTIPLYTPTEIQQLKLQVMQKDAQLLQAQLQTVQRLFQEKVSELMSTAQKIKLENSWPPETVFDPDKLVFSAPTVKEEKKP